MDLRSPGVPDEPSGADDTLPHGSRLESGDVAGRGYSESGDVAGRSYTESRDVAGRGYAESVARSTGSVAFAVPTRVIIVKFTIAVVVALASMFADTRSQLIVGLLASAGLLAYALRDVLARVRLAADTEGVVAVHGYAGHRRLAWAEIERVRVDARNRLGARSELLEVDAGDQIFLFSRFDLGVDPEEAAQAIQVLRPRG